MTTASRHRASWTQMSPGQSCVDLRTSACGSQEHLQGPRLRRAALAVVWTWESRLRWLLRLSRSRQVPYILCAEATEHGLPLEGGDLGSGVSFGLGCSLKGPQLWPAQLPRRGTLGSCPVPTISHLGHHCFGCNYLNLVLWKLCQQLCPQISGTELTYFKPSQKFHTKHSVEEAPENVS